MLEISDIKLPHTAISSHRGEDILVFAEMDIINFLIMGNKLGINRSLFNIPDGAGGIDGAGADKVDFLRVPVEGSQRGAKLVVLSWREITFLRSSFSLTSELLTIYHTFKFYPEVASKSGVEPV